MAGSVASLSVLSVNSVPKFGYVPDARVRVSNEKTVSAINCKFSTRNWRRSSSWKLNAAGLQEIEPDLNEDPKDRWATNSIDEVCFLVNFLHLIIIILRLPDAFFLRFFTYGVRFNFKIKRFYLLVIFISHS